MDDPFGLIKVNYVLIFMIFNPLVFLSSSVGYVPSSNIPAISSISLFYFFVFSSPIVLLSPFNRLLINAISLLFLAPRLFNTFSSARGSGEPFVVPICLCHGQKGTGSGFFVRVLRFPPPSPQYHFTNAPYSFTHHRCYIKCR